MSLSLSKKLVLGIASLFTAGTVAAMDINKLPPENWTVPKTTGVHTMTDATSPRAFIGLPPCRIVDTRGTAGVPINTGGAFAANETRTYTFTGLCGLPATVNAVSLNFTVTGTQANPFGYLSAAPGGTPPPATTSILNWNTGGVTESNAAIVPLNGSGQIAVETFNAGAHVLVDVNGYFSNILGSPGNYFELDNNSSGFTMFLTNGNSSCIGPCGLKTFVANGTAIYGDSATTGDGVYGTSDDASGAGVHGTLSPDVGLSKAVWGEHQSTGFGGIGVYGSHAGNGFGVWGEAKGTTGIAQIGVLGRANSNSNGVVGVWGRALATSGANYGVYGDNSSVSFDSAGVLGVSVGRPVAAGKVRTGVRGESVGLGYGVLGLTENSGSGFGVIGLSLDSAGATVRGGSLGDAADGLGVSYFGGLGGSGTKNFIEPHPTDPEKVIRYASLEGPEAGTYFRGTGHIVHGQAVIAVPEDFRIVTDDDGLTVQLTPIGAASSMYVESRDLNQIVVKASKDVTFDYLVQGVRRNYKDFEVVAKSPFFQPRSPNDRMIESLSDGEKARLINNGTFNADGTVNMQTAERLGWLKAWADRQAADEAAARRAREAETQSRGQLPQ